MGWEREKKSDILGGPAEGGPPEGGPAGGRSAQPKPQGVFVQAGCSPPGPEARTQAGGLVVMAARVDAAGGTSSARRRRERRLRSMLRHERMAVAMALAEAQHAALRGQETGTRAGVAGPAPVIEYVAHAPAVVDAAPAPVTFHEAFPRVVGPLPPCEVVSAPVFDHLVQFAAGETLAKSAKFPVVLQQVIVQAIPRFVGSLPPVDDFTAYVARRPPPLVEVRPSVRAQRHIVEDLGELAPLVQILDLPVPQTVDYMTPCGCWIARWPSRLFLCPRSPAPRLLCVLEFLSRSQRISWWKCRPS